MKLSRAPWTSHYINNIGHRNSSDGFHEIKNGDLILIEKNL
jgi:hypothetical protein